MRRPISIVIAAALATILLPSMARAQFGGGGIGGGGIGGGGDAHLRQTHTLAFSPDGNVLAGGGRGNVVRLWNVENGLLRPTLSGPTGPLREVAISSDGTMLATACEDRFAYVWSLQSGQLLYFNEHPGPVNSVAFSADGRQLASGYFAKDRGEPEVLLWEAATGKLLRRLPQESGRICGLAFSPDGQSLFAGFARWPFPPETPDGVQQWDIESGKLTGLLKLEPLSPRSMAVSADGKYLAYGTRGQVLVWEIASAKLVRTLFEIGDHDFQCAVFSPDGKSLAAGTSHGVLRVWDVRNSRQMWQREARHGNIYSLAFSKDGSKLAMADGEVRIFDFHTAGVYRDLLPEAPPAQKAPPENGQP